MFLCFIVDTDPGKQALVLVVPRFCLPQNPLHLRGGVAEVGRNLVELIYNLAQQRERDHAAGTGSPPISLDVGTKLLVPLVSGLDDGLELILGIQSPPTLLVLLQLHPIADGIATLEMVADIVNFALVFCPFLRLHRPVPSIGLDL